MKTILISMMIAMSGISLTNNAQAYGGESGGGGDAIVCFPSTATGVSQKEALEKLVRSNRESVLNNPRYRQLLSQIESVQVLDYWEASQNQFRSQQLLTNADIGNTDPKDYLIAYLEKLSDKTALGRDFKEILAAEDGTPFGNWSSVDGVFEINDSQEDYFLPSSCLLVQAAVNNNKRVVINKHLYNLMDPINKFTLLLHEVAYMNERESARNLKNSKETRLFMRTLLRSDLFEISLENFEKALKLGNKYDGDKTIIKFFPQFLGSFYVYDNGSTLKAVKSINLDDYLLSLGIKSEFKAEISVIEVRSESSRIIGTDKGSFELTQIGADVSIYIDVNEHLSGIPGDLFSGKIKFKDISGKWNYQGSKLMKLEFGTYTAGGVSLELANISFEGDQGTALYIGNTLYEVVNGTLMKDGPNLRAYNNEIAVESIVCKPSIFTRVTDKLNEGSVRIGYDSKQKRCLKNREQKFALIAKKYNHLILGLRGSAKLGFSRDGYFRLVP